MKGGPARWSRWSSRKRRRPVVLQAGDDCAVEAVVVVLLAAAGTVFSQTPSPGATVGHGAIITLVVARSTKR